MPATRGNCGRAAGLAAVVAASVAVQGGPGCLFSLAPWAGQQRRPSSSAAAAAASDAKGAGVASPASVNVAPSWNLLAGAAAATFCAVQVHGATTRRAAKPVREWEKKKAGYKPDPEAEAAEAAAKAAEEEVVLPPFDPSAQLGVTEPLGYFDPLNFCPPGDEGNFRQLRAAEIKHGRVAMMASAGAVVQHFIRFPGFEDAPSGFTAAWGDPSIWGMFGLFFISGAFEIAIWTEPEDERFQPGDFGDPLGLAQLDTETRNKELNNGRLAMFTSMGIISAELLTKKDGIEQFGLGL